MRVISLGSGSTGNAYVVASGRCRVLIDCGLAFKSLRGLVGRIGLGEPAFDAVLVTHSHGDHTKGLRTLASRTGVSLFANAMTAETVAREEKIDEGAFCLFENGQSFDVGPFTVLPFAIPHDTSDPVGFLVRDGDGTTYFHGTDIGTPLDSIGVKLAEADLATLESNHDPVLLRQSGRAPCLIQRIAGPRGHLSNDQACELVRRFASPRLKALALAHLSSDCNVPHLAENAMRQTLHEMARDDVELKVLSPTEPVELAAP